MGSVLKMVEGGRPWLTAFNLFAYEFATATLLRVLQLSIPNEHIAQLMSLFSTVAEVCVRVFFFNRFKFAQRGKLRVVDGGGDVNLVLGANRRLFVRNERED